MEVREMIKEISERVHLYCKLKKFREPDYIVIDSNSVGGLSIDWDGDRETQSYDLDVLSQDICDMEETMRKREEEEKIALQKWMKERAEASEKKRIEIEKQMYEELKKKYG